MCDGGLSWWDLGPALAGGGLVVGAMVVRHLCRRPSSRETDEESGAVWHLLSGFIDLLGSFLWFL